MLPRIVLETLRRRGRRVAVAIVAVAVGSSLAATLLTISFGVADKVNRELKAYGANLLVTPRTDDATPEGRDPAVPGSGALLDETELPKLKTIFWRNNILGFAPYLSTMVAAGPGGEPVVLTGTWFDRELSVPAGTLVGSAISGQETLAQADRFRGGVKAISPWWKVNGAWASDEDSREAMVGASMAERLKLSVGQSLDVRHGEVMRRLRVVGIISTGGLEEEQIFVGLPVAQSLLGVDRGASRVLVSALTLPKEKLPENLRDKKPAEMTPKEYETWYCTPILESVAVQIEEAISGSQARAIRQVSEAEGAFVARIELLIALVTAVALVASALAVATTMTAAVLERRGEIGLMKAIGADDRQVALIFLAEAGILGLAGGALGFAVGLQLARWIGATVFGSAIALHPMVLPTTVLLALGVALAGSALPIRATTRVQPVVLLKGG